MGYGLSPQNIAPIEKLSAFALSGYHLSGSIVMGGAYVIKKVHIISFGYLVPLRDVDAPDGIVLEYTYAPLSNSGKGG